MDFFPSFQPACISVSDLTRYLRMLLESDELLQEVWVEGEVSNLSRPASGHIYFTLKDSSCALRCVIWRSTAQRLSIRLQDGAALQVHGNISLYEASGQYQLYVDQIRSAGEGALYMEFLRLKARLESEGLFDPQRKRLIPAWPRKIGIVTSPSGAALQDMLNTLRRRFPIVEVYVAPTAVQGAEAPFGIVSALQALNQSIHPDVILVARGGGSIEDLWAFNDERVAYAIAASAAPVISGVGHETDFTIADFAADLRAPTPTAAAELATPDQEDLRLTLHDRVASLIRSYESSLDTQRWKLAETQGQLRMFSPLRQIRENRQRLDDLTRSAEQAMLYNLLLQKAHLSGLHTHLQAVNPLAILERGYALVTQLEDGKIVKSTNQVQEGSGLNVRLADGSFPVRVTAPPSETP